LSGKKNVQRIFWIRLMVVDQATKTNPSFSLPTYAY
jgi:hypothetical protein